jgi:non-ribosomal peptide synthetase component F
MKQSNTSQHGLHHPFGYGEIVKSPFPTLTSAFYYQVEQHASNLAVRDLSGDDAQDVTYQELAERVQVLSAHLRGLGVRPRQRVPLVVKRGVEMIIGIWAILSCGAQYVPLDGGVVPDSTIRHVVEQSGGEVVLCLSTTAFRVQDLCPEAIPVIIEHNSVSERKHKRAVPHTDLAAADDGCYVIYTSGKLAFEIFWASVPVFVSENNN